MLTEEILSSDWDSITLYLEKSNPLSVDKTNGSTISLNGDLITVIHPDIPVDASGKTATATHRLQLKEVYMVTTVKHSAVLKIPLVRSMGKA